MLPGADALLPLAHGLFALLAGALQPLAQSSLALWQQPAAPAMAVALALAGCALLLLPAGVGIRWLGLLAFLPLLTYAPARPAPGTAQVRVLDVGQGLAVHVQTAAHDLVFDTGPAFSSETDSGNRIIVPYLRAQGVRTLDALVLSHPDRDHVGGARSLGRDVPLSLVRHSLPADDSLLPELVDEGMAAPTPAVRCAAGQRWEWDGVAFSILYPPPHALARDDNAMSCVLSVSAAGKRLLMTADIEAADERWLVAHADQLPADILVVPHHGSKTSSIPAFIDAVAAREAIFTVGYRNRSGHPRADVVARYAASGAQMHRTDRDGALTFMLDNHPVRVLRQRQSRPRYWHDG